MNVLLVLQPDDEIIGSFDMDTIPRVGDNVTIQTDERGYESEYTVTAVHWSFTTVMSINGSSVQIDVESKTSIRLRTKEYILGIALLRNSRSIRLVAFDSLSKFYEWNTKMQEECNKVMCLESNSVMGVFYANAGFINMEADCQSSASSSNNSNTGFCASGDKR